MKLYRHLLMILVCLAATGCGSERSINEIDSSTLALTTDGSRYFVSLYGYQGTGRMNLPRRSHTWARFAAFEGSDLRESEVYQFAISWLAADADIGFGQGVEAGKNFSHAETMSIAANAPVFVQRTPYIEIDATLHADALARLDALTVGASTGKVKYKMFDDLTGRRNVLSGNPGGYTNCTHGVSDLAAERNGGLLTTGVKRGFDASYAVFDWFVQGTGVIDRYGVNDAVVAQRLITQ
jgi:hypothetical protein